MPDSVFVNKRSAIHKGSQGKSMAFPDVCLCPPSPPAGPIPTPLPNMCQAADLQGGASSVLINGNPMAKRTSYIGKSTGNSMARPTGGGVVTHVVEGKAYFTSYSMDVTAEGEEVPRHLDMMTHNHAAQTPPNAAVGVYLGSMDVSVMAPVKKSEKDRKDVMQPIEVCLDDPDGDGKADGSFELSSTDGKYKQTISGGQAKKAGASLLSLKFPDVLPGRSYNLVHVVNGERLTIFAGVSFRQIRDHKPAAPQAPTDAAKPARASKASRKTAAQDDDDSPLKSDDPLLGTKPIDHDPDWYADDPDEKT